MLWGQGKCKCSAVAEGVAMARKGRQRGGRVRMRWKECCWNAPRREEEGREGLESKELE